MPASIGERRMRTLSASRRSGLPRWNPPRPIAETRSPVRPTVRMEMLPVTLFFGTEAVVFLRVETVEPLMRSSHHRLPSLGFFRARAGTQGNEKYARRHAEGMKDQITPRQFHETAGVEDWRVVGEGACAFFRTESFATGARLVTAISELAGLDEHHPDVDLRHEGVMVRLITVRHDYMGMTERDVELARQISAVARKPGGHAGPAVAETVQLIVGAHANPKLQPLHPAVPRDQDRADRPEDEADPRSRRPP